MWKSIWKNKQVAKYFIQIIWYPFILLLLSLGSASYAYTLRQPSLSVPANCSFSVINGWTQTINFQCVNDVVLNGATLQFTVDYPAGLLNPSSVWGFGGLSSYPINPSLTINGNTVTLTFTFSSSPVILSAGQTTSISYSTNNAVNVTGLALYPDGTLNTGSLTLVQSKQSEMLPQDTVISITGNNTHNVFSLTFSNQQIFSNIPYDTYSVSARASQNGSPVIVNALPSSVTLSSAQPSQTASLSFVNPNTYLDVALMQNKPQDVSSSTIPVNVTDGSNSYPVSVPWGGAGKLVGLTLSHTYAISAPVVIGNKNLYQFSFTPHVVQPVTGINSVATGVNVTPLPTGMLSLVLSGLPSNATTNMTVTSSAGTVYSYKGLVSGTSTYSFPAGYTYQASFSAAQTGSYRYLAPPISFSITKNKISTANTVFTGTPYVGIQGWPTWIAMGGVTDDGVATLQSFQSRPVDAIFKYGGLGGDGDPGQIVYPIFDKLTAQQAASLTATYKTKKLKNVVMPVMVIYTAQMSSGASMSDFLLDNMTKHFINLMMESQKIQQFSSLQNPFPGSIILNPDLLGMVQQQNLMSKINSAISAVSLKTALSVAVCFVTSTIDSPYGAKLNYEQLFEKINQTTDQWTAMSIWNSYASQYYKNCSHSPILPPGFSLPTFTNDFPGWVQANNWIIRHFGPTISFGWQENLWSVGSANWVHQNYTTDQLATQISAPVVSVLNASTAYSGKYPADFIIFDKYEMDDIPGALGSGYLFNARDWGNVLSFVGDVSVSLNNTPVMLWQIPGGHLQTTQDIDGRINHSSTSPDYFFGDMANPLLNIAPWITAQKLPATLYGMQNIINYLSMDPSGKSSTYVWQLNNLVLAAKKNVFAILWGGGNTTSVSSFPSDDSGVLSTKIINYYKNPVVRQ